MISAFLKKISLGLLFVSGISFAATPDYQAVVNKAYQLYKDDNNGTVANYIPELATYNPKYYGIVLVTTDGKVYQAGDTKLPFPVESLSKVFTVALLMQQSGSDLVSKDLGANATGMPFNSVMAIEEQADHMENPLVNAGAIATVSLIQGKSSDDKWNKIIGMMNSFSNNKLSVNQKVYKSESDTNQHNQAIAELLESYGKLYGDPKEAVDLYTRQCSVNATAYDLAVMGSVLANGGVSPLTDKQVINAQYVPKVLALMATAGLYDNTGDWLYNVGLPAKSGVGGGMLAVMPGKFAIAVYSPPLDIHGNSVRGQEAIAYIAAQLNANIFTAQQPQ
jgi:glutaminase